MGLIAFAPLSAVAQSQVRLKGKGRPSPFSQQRGDLYLTIEESRVTRCDSLTSKVSEIIGVLTVLATAIFRKFGHLSVNDDRHKDSLYR
jgi:DnaJ-class molecular chaperone